MKRVKVHTAQVAEQSRTEASSAQGSMMIGRLVGFDKEGRALVTHDFNSLHTPEPALSLAVLNESSVGCDLAISRLANAPTDLLIMGIIQSPVLNPDVGERDMSEPETTEPENKPVLEIDGEKLQLIGKKEITLRCGKASITLTQSGKILIKGEHIVNRASGSNRILGGAIQLN